MSTSPLSLNQTRDAKRKRNKLVLILIAVLAIFSIGIWSVVKFKNGGEAGMAMSAMEKGGKPQGVPIALAALTSKPITVDHVFMATVDNRMAIDLKPRVQGYVSQILVSPGQYVQQGQLLMTLDAKRQDSLLKGLKASKGSAVSAWESAKSQIASLNQQVSAAKAQLDYAQDQYNRYVILKKKSAVSAQQFDEIETAFKKAQADYASAVASVKTQQSKVNEAQSLIAESNADIQSQQEDINYFQIRAPFSGSVGDIPTKVGDYVINSDILTTVTQGGGEVDAVFEAPVEVLDYLSAGSDVYATTEAGQQSYTGSVRFIEDQVSENAQTVIIRTKLAPTANANYALRNGQKIRLHLQEQRGTQMVIPVEAVVRFSGKAFVYTTKVDTEKGGMTVASMIPVTLGPIEGNDYSVTDIPLKLGAPIIVGGIQKLQDGVPVMDKAKMQQQQTPTPKIKKAPPLSKEKE